MNSNLEHWLIYGSIAHIFYLRLRYITLKAPAKLWRK